MYSFAERDHLRFWSGPTHQPKGINVSHSVNSKYKYFACVNTSQQIMQESMLLSDKSHLWLNIVNLMISIEKNCLFLINCNSDSPFFSCCPSLSSPWWKRSRPLEAVTWWECFRNESTLSHCMKFIQFTKHNSNQFKRDEILVMSENKRWQQGWLLGFKPTLHRSNLFRHKFPFTMHAFRMFLDSSQ